MLSILALSPCYPPAPGGAEASLHETLRRLVQRGWSARVLTFAECPALSAFGGLPEEEERDGVRVRRTDPGRLPALLAGAAPAADLIFYQLHMQFLGAGLAMNKLLAPYRARLVYFMRVHPYDVYPAAVLVANSRWMLAEATARQPGTGGLHVVLSPPVVCPPAAGPPRRRYVTLVNPVEHKGGDLFVELARRLPAVEFLAQLGWGRKLARSFESPPPNIVQRPPTDRMGDTYAETAVLLVPSHSEPFGRVALEGALAGCLVLAHRTQGLAEVPLPEECFVDGLDVEAWERRLTSLLARSRQDQEVLREATRVRARAYDCGFEDFAALLGREFGAPRPPGDA